MTENKEEKKETNPLILVFAIIILIISVIQFLMVW